MKLGGTFASATRFFWTSEFFFCVCWLLRTLFTHKYLQFQAVNSEPEGLIILGKKIMVHQFLAHMVAHFEKD